jgi:hypothetical protein
MQKLTPEDVLLSVDNSINFVANIHQDLKHWPEIKLFSLGDEPLYFCFRVGISDKYLLLISTMGDIIDTALIDKETDNFICCKELGYNYGSDTKHFHSINDLKKELLRLHKLLKK